MKELPNAYTEKKRSYNSDEKHSHVIEKQYSRRYTGANRNMKIRSTDADKKKTQGVSLLAAYS